MFASNIAFFSIRFFQNLHFFPDFPQHDAREKKRKKENKEKKTLQDY